MKTVGFTGLPAGSAVLGVMYDDPSVRYETGDMLEISLPSGYMIDVSWDDSVLGEPFVVTVWRQHFGDHGPFYRVRNTDEVVAYCLAVAAALEKPDER